MSPALALYALPGLGEVHAGDDLAVLACAALARAELTLAAGDVLVLAQKIVSKSEGRSVPLHSVVPGAQALELSAQTGKDARLVELVLRESAAVLRQRPGVLIVRHRLGFVMANAGIDQSNVDHTDAGECALLLPQDPDASAARVRQRLGDLCGTCPAVVVSDSFGRPWRVGSTNIALGTAGLAALIDRRGEQDRFGRTLKVTQVAVADALAGAAGLVMGEGAEGLPMVLVRGWSHPAPERNGQSLLRPAAEDLFV